MEAWINSKFDTSDLYAWGKGKPEQQRTHFTPNENKKEEYLYSKFFDSALED